MGASDAGAVFHVPPRARHALRNVSDATSSVIVASTRDMMRFFLETGEPLTDGVTPSPASAERIERLLRAAADHGHWIASPDENLDAA